MRGIWADTVAARTRPERLAVPPVNAPDTRRVASRPRAWAEPVVAPGQPPAPAQSPLTGAKDCGRARPSSADPARVKPEDEPERALGSVEPAQAAAEGSGRLLSPSAARMSQARRSLSSAATRLSQAKPALLALAGRTGRSVDETGPDLASAGGVKRELPHAASGQSDHTATRSSRDGDVARARLIGNAETREARAPALSLGALPPAALRAANAVVGHPGRSVSVTSEIGIIRLGGLHSSHPQMEAETLCIDHCS